MGGWLFDWADRLTDRMASRVVKCLGDPVLPDWLVDCIVLTGWLSGWADRLGDCMACRVVKCLEDPVLTDWLVDCIVLTGWLSGWADRLEKLYGLLCSPNAWGIEF